MNLFSWKNKLKLKILLFIFYLIHFKKSSSRKSFPGYRGYKGVIFGDQTRYLLSSGKVALPYRGFSRFTFSENHIWEILNARNLENVEKVDRHYIHRDHILPIANITTLYSNDKLGKKCEVEDKTIENFKSNAWHYVRFSSDRSLQNFKERSKSGGYYLAAPFILGRIGSKPKQLIHIFVDNLSGQFLTETNYRHVPNLNSFFSTGATLENTYAGYEWTIPSMANVFTGVNCRKNNVYLPRKYNKLRVPTLASKIAEIGVHTCGLSNLSPMYGFDYGFDRYLYSPRSFFEDNVGLAISNLKALKNSDFYFFLALQDMHEAHTVQPFDQQINYSIDNFKFPDEIMGSKDAGKLFDQQRLKRYGLTLSAFDENISVFLNFINESLPEAEVCLHSDHGINFMTKTTNIVDRERTKAMIFLSKGLIPRKYTHGIKPLGALHGTILKYFDQNLSNDLNTLDEKYSTVVTESVYPGSTHKIVVRNGELSAFFESNQNLTNATTESVEYSMYVTYTGSEEIKMNLEDVSDITKQHLISSMKRHIGLKENVKISI